MSSAIQADPGSGQGGMALELSSLNIARIQPYEHDPRRVPNREYARIKASIRADGLSQPLVVTRRPGVKDYVVHGGGNTRLRILKELFEETGERRFAEVPCVIRPWSGEADVLLAHLKENDLRGDLTFVDKALAIADVKQLLEQAAGESLTQAQLAATLQQCGYGLSQGLISQMAYVVERLAPVLPRALEAGLGRPQVAKIRSLDRIVRSLWLARGVDSEEEYDQAFQILCRRYDTPDWDIDNLRRALAVEIAERADISLQAVSLEIDQLMSGQQLALPADAPGLGANGRVLEVGTQHRGTPRSGMPGPDVPDKDATAPADRPGRRATGNAAGCHSSDETSAGDEAGAQTPHDGADVARTDLKSLRARLWTLASRLAQRNGLGELVQPLSGRGLGFVLSDVPDPALAAQLDEDELAQVSMVWWYLAACAELTVAPLDALLPALPEASVLRRALVDQDARLLFSSIWTLDPGHMGYRLWCRLDDRNWQDLLALMETYRALRRSVSMADRALWSDA